VPEIKPRYEFRVWDDSLAPLRAKLEAMGPPREAKSAETYLISGVTERCNAKIRSGFMDIKILVAKGSGLEQWKPILKAAFPLSQMDIASQVFPALQIVAPTLVNENYSAEEFLRTVVRPQPKISVVAVTKTRYRFINGTCVAEYSQVVINGVPRDTVAVESTDADAVLQLVDKLGIRGPNVSYVREIRRILSGSST
jgi:exopolyphosphatase / guanosine-5'-triphosphate,3'-diphosphate pyrophosphatase